jgi:hypothetical protein
MMIAFLAICGLVESIFGVIVFRTALSAVHEILAVLSIGFAVLTFALASILNEMRNTLKPLPR